MMWAGSFHGTRTIGVARSRLDRLQHRHHVVDVDWRRAACRWSRCPSPGRRRPRRRRRWDGDPAADAGSPSASILLEAFGFSWSQGVILARELILEWRSQSLALLQHFGVEDVALGQPAVEDSRARSARPSSDMRIMPSAVVAAECGVRIMRSHFSSGSSGLRRLVDLHVEGGAHDAPAVRAPPAAPPRRRCRRVRS